jgi:hypothetical protein
VRFSQEWVARAPTLFTRKIQRTSAAKRDRKGEKGAAASLARGSDDGFDGDRVAAEEEEAIDRDDVDDRPSREWKAGTKRIVVRMRLPLPSSGTAGRKQPHPRDHLWASRREREGRPTELTRAMRACGLGRPPAEARHGARLAMALPLRSVSHPIRPRVSPSRLNLSSCTRGGLRFRAAGGQWPSRHGERSQVVLAVGDGKFSGPSKSRVP